MFQNAERTAQCHVALWGTDASWRTYVTQAAQPEWRPEYWSEVRVIVARMEGAR